MSRWRDIKQGKQSPTKKTKTIKEKNYENNFQYASILDRLKAFLTDTFMLMMPIMYLIIYIVMGSLKDAGNQKIITWSYILIILGIVVISFYTISGQTPGLKAYNLKVIDIQTGKKPNIILSFLRYLLFNITFFTFIGLFLPLFRKDKRALYDLLSGTAIVKENK